ncbi:hypothetical protein E4T56_gene8488, partial [Termitomyces sp. T112]
FAEGVGYFGHLDLLFNNAGIGAPPLSIEELSLETFQQVITVNLIGPFLCTREAVKIFKSQSPQGGELQICPVHHSISKQLFEVASSIMALSPHTYPDPTPLLTPVPSTL